MNLETKFLIFCIIGILIIFLTFIILFLSFNVYFSILNGNDPSSNIQSLSILTLLISLDLFLFLILFGVLIWEVYNDVNKGIEIVKKFQKFEGYIGYLPQILERMRDFLNKESNVNMISNINKRMEESESSENYSESDDDM
jgi:heme/copper-type cytochrome/quinol oxidase subunit 2